MDANTLNIVMLVGLVILTVIMTIKNFKRINEYKKDKSYIDLYTKVLRGQEEVHEELKKYIAQEKDACLNTKARIVKTYDDILLGTNPSEEFKEVDIKNIYYVDNKFSSEKAKLNSEIFVWLTLMLSKARCLSMIDLMNEIHNKVDTCKDDLKVLVEYQVFNSAYNSLLEKGTEGIVFLKQLLAGDYSEYVYDKNLIGIYKKIAACILVYMGEPIDEADEAMLPEFTGTLVGNRFTKDLEIYNKYAPIEEEREASETNTEVKEEPLNKENIQEEVTSDSNDEETNKETIETKEEPVENTEVVDDTPNYDVEETSNKEDESFKEISNEEKKIEEIKSEIESQIKEDIKDDDSLKEDENINTEVSDIKEETLNNNEDEEIKQANIKKAEDELLSSFGNFGEENK